MFSAFSADSCICFYRIYSIEIIRKSQYRLGNGQISYCKGFVFNGMMALVKQRKEQINPRRKSEEKVMTTALSGNRMMKHVVERKSLRERFADYIVENGAEIVSGGLALNGNTNGIAVYRIMKNR